MLTLGRPLAASGILVSLLGIAGFSLYATLANLSVAATERDAKVELLASLKTRGPTSRGRAPAARLTFAALSGTQAAAAFDAMVRSTVIEAGGTLMSSRAESKRERSAAGNRIEVQAVVEGRMEALQKILYNLESKSPLVFVDTLSLRPADVSGADPRAPLLHETLFLSAYWETPAR